MSWRVNGISGSTTKELYKEEITNATKKYTAKIGLMYVSDYGYATIQDYWTTDLYNYDTAAYQKDWLYLGKEEWTLSYHSGFSNRIWNVTSGGRAYRYIVTATYAVRPSFYLLSSIQYSSGSGTSTDPIRISL